MSKFEPTDFGRTGWQPEPLGFATDGVTRVYAHVRSPTWRCVCKPGVCPGDDASKVTLATNPNAAVAAPPTEAI